TTTSLKASSPARQIGRFRSSFLTGMTMVTGSNSDSLTRVHAGSNSNFWRVDNATSKNTASVPLSRLAAKFRDRITQHFVDGGTVIATEALLEHRNPGADGLERWPHWSGGYDSGDSDFGRFLLALEKNLV